MKTRLRQNQVVHIRSSKAEATGAVADARTLENLMEIPGFDVQEVQAILAEQGVEQVALITYEYGNRTVCFAAWLNDEGWHDMKGNELDIEPAEKQSLLLSIDQTRYPD